LTGGGEGEGEGSLHAILSYDFQYSLLIFQNIAIPKPQYFVPLLNKDFIPLCVCFSHYRMLTTIEFNDESLFETDKINYEISDRLLSSELYSLNLSSFQLLP